MKGKNVEVVGEVDVDLKAKEAAIDRNWLTNLIEQDIKDEMARALQGGVRAARRVTPANLQAYIDAYQVGSDTRALERRAKAISALPREDQEKLLDDAPSLLVRLVHGARLVQETPKVAKPPKT